MRVQHLGNSIAEGHGDGDAGEDDGEDDQAAHGGRGGGVLLAAAGAIEPAEPSGEGDVDGGEGECGGGGGEKEGEVALVAEKDGEQIGEHGGHRYGRMLPRHLESGRTPASSIAGRRRGGSVCSGSVG